MPDYFEALNRDLRYQLTVIGKAALAMFEREIEDNTFTIRTDKLNVKVSWQVMGTRHDPAILASHLPVEEEKPEAERGFVEYPRYSNQTEDRFVPVKEMASTTGLSEKEQAVA